MTAVINLSPPVVLWNPSTASADRADVVMQELRRWPEVLIERPRSEEEATEILKEHSGPGARIIAAGGDGTVRRTVNLLMRLESQATLGILPLGSGNDLARTLEIPFEPLEALDVIRKGIPQPLDVFEFETAEESGFCANMVTGGNSGRYAEVMTSELKERWGAFCYLRGVIDVLQNLEPFTLTLTRDEDPPETFDVLNFFCANGRSSGGGLVVSPEADSGDGQIDLVIVQDGDAGAIAGLTASYFLSDYKNHELISFRRARQLRIECDPPQPLTADGDTIGHSPVTVRIHAGALRVLTPPPPENGLV